MALEPATTPASIGAPRSIGWTMPVLAVAALSMFVLIEPYFVSQEWRFDDRHSPAMFALMAVVLGRVLLSWLPAGDIGSHRLRDLGTTWAASYAIGGLGLGLLMMLSGPFRPKTVMTDVTLLAGVAAVLLGLLRWWTLPAPLVPRHAPLTEPLGAGGRILATLTLAVAGAPVLFALAHMKGFELLGALDWLAFVLLARYVLAQARRAPTEAWLALLAFAPLPLLIGFNELRTVPLRVDLGIAACFMVPWLRRGDRRALWLTLLVLILQAVFRTEWWSTGVTGFLVLLLFTPALSRARVARLGVLLGLVIVIPWMASLWATREYVRPDLDRGPLLDRLQEACACLIDFTNWGPSWILIGIALVLLVFPEYRRPRRTAEGIDEPVRETKALALFFLLGLAAAPFLSQAGFVTYQVAAIWPIGALLACLMLTRAEVPSTSAVPRES